MNRVQIRPTMYHSRPGFLVSGGGTLYCQRAFTTSRHNAELIKRALKADLTPDERFTLINRILAHDPT